MSAATTTSHDTGQQASPRRRTTAPRVFHAERELLAASKLILDTKNPAYRAMAAAQFEAVSCGWPARLSGSEGPRPEPAVG